MLTEIVIFLNFPAFSRLTRPLFGSRARNAEAPSPVECRDHVTARKSLARDKELTAMVTKRKTPPPPGLSAADVERLDTWMPEIAEEARAPARRGQRKFPCRRGSWSGHQSRRRFHDFIARKSGRGAVELIRNCADATRSSRNHRLILAQGSCRHRRALRPRRPDEEAG